MTSPNQDQSAADPLESLLIDAAEVDRAAIANTLRDLVAIDSATGNVVFRPSARLNSKQKILAYLLGRKVSRLLGKIDVEAVQPKTIISDTGLASGTVHPKLKELREERAVSQESDGAYWIAPFQLHHALEMVKVEGDSS